MTEIAILSFVWSLFVFMAPNGLAQPPEISLPQLPLPGPGPLSNVEKQLDEMPFRELYFGVPSNINIEDSSHIQLTLSLAETTEELEKSIIEEGKKIGDTISVKDRMEARLAGDWFQVKAITPEIQAVSKGHLTEWKWEIHPKEVGQHELGLTLIAHLEIDGHSTLRAIRTFTRVINVNAPLAAPNPEFGVLFLGIFIGSILGYGLFKSGGNLKAALTVVGAALGGGPIVFMENIQDARWAYPIGLILGLLVLRGIQARRDIFDARQKTGKRVFAWIDLIVIVGVTIGSAVWMAW